MEEGTKLVILKCRAMLKCLDHVVIESGNMQYRHTRTIVMPKVRSYVRTDPSEVYAPESDGHLYLP